MTSLLPVRYKDKTQLISKRCAVHSLHHFHLSQCSETSLCLPPIVITQTNVNYLKNIKNISGIKVFLVMSYEMWETCPITMQWPSGWDMRDLPDYHAMAKRVSYERYVRRSPLQGMGLACFVFVKTLAAWASRVAKAIIILARFSFVAIPEFSTMMDFHST